METQTNPPKKVRLACQRCRTRRIKCDGQVPACTNCAKAGEACIDVDSQNSRILIPRNFASAAKARIQWLEGIIRERAPDVDLKGGPSVDLPEAPRSGERDNDVITVLGSPSSGPGESSVPPRTEAHPPSRHSRKRSADASGPTDHDSTFPERAHSVAVNLGMLSLNSDSPQKHYLGSSSGLLFANLVGASPSTPGSTPRTHTDEHFTPAAGPEWHDGGVLDYNQQYHRSILDILKQELPRKEDAIILAHTYIRWVHPEYPVMEPSSIMSALDALYYCASSSPDEHLWHNGWPRMTPPFRWNGRQVSVGSPDDDAVSLSVIAFILFMIFNIAAVVKVRTRVYEFPPDRFYRTAMQFSQGAFANMSLPSIQCLVVLICSSMLSPGQVKLWTLVHLALAHCVELGIHREPQDDDETDRASKQIQRFIFWTAYSLDRSISSIQGRPLGFRDETFDVKTPTDVDDGTTLSSFSNSVTQYSVHRYQLDRIVSDIKLHLYHLPGGAGLFPRPANPKTYQSDIQGKLVQWREEASQKSFNLDDRQRQIWRLKLKIQFHTAMILLFQPSQVVRHPSEEALKTCFDNALSILHDYQLLHDIHGLHFGWRAVQNIFAAGATLIYSYWTSALVRSTASVSDTSRSLRTCSDLLTIGGEWWPSAKTGQRSFNAVADLTIRKLYMQDVPSKHPCLAPFPESTYRPLFAADNTQLEDIIPQIPTSSRLIGPIPESTGPYRDPSSRPIFDVSDIDLEAESSFQAIHPINTEEAASGIENFLADFDRSEFSWGFALDNTRFDFDAFPGPGL